MSLLGLAVVPDEPDQQETIAIESLSNQGEADPAEEFPEPIGTSYKTEAVVSQDDELGDAGY